MSADQISVLAWTGSEPPAFPVFPVSKGFNGAAVALWKPITVPDVTKDDRYLTTFGTTRSEAIFPVMSYDGKKVVGTIDVDSNRANADRVDPKTLSPEATITSDALIVLMTCQNDGYAALRF
ncbi:MAG TPA: hypothetical protein VJA66_04875 [Thermoanaerobaculia bacterium]